MYGLDLLGKLFNLLGKLFIFLGELLDQLLIVLNLLVKTGCEIGTLTITAVRMAGRVLIKIIKTLV
jgi:hypothetical protein